MFRTSLDDVFRRHCECKFRVGDKFTTLDAMDAYVTIAVRVPFDGKDKQSHAGGMLPFIVRGDL